MFPRRCFLSTLLNKLRFQQGWCIHGNHILYGTRGGGEKTDYAMYRQKNKTQMDETASQSSLFFHLIIFNEKYPTVTKNLENCDP